MDTTLHALNVHSIIENVRQKMLAITKITNILLVHLFRLKHFIKYNLTKTLMIHEIHFWVISL